MGLGGVDILQIAVRVDIMVSYEKYENEKRYTHKLINKTLGFTGMTLPHLIFCYIPKFVRKVYFFGKSCCSADSATAVFYSVFHRSMTGDGDVQLTIVYNDKYNGTEHNG